MTVFRIRIRQRANGTKVYLMLCLSITILLSLGNVGILNTIYQENSYYDTSTMGGAYDPETVRGVNSSSVSGSYNAINCKSREVNWLNASSFRRPQYFSATWLQPVSLFMQLNTATMMHLEDPSHVAYKTHKSSVRMPLDWLDFSVEHMSRWWKVLQVTDSDQNSVAIDRITTNFLDYVRSTSPDSSSLDILHPTLALIAFAPVEATKRGSSVEEERAANLTITSLGATIASLVRSGFGRIVVVGRFESERALVNQSFEMLNPHSSSIEYAYVHVDGHEPWYRTRRVRNNLPRAAVVGLQLALQGALSRDEIEAWLGTSYPPPYWKFVYFTEADSILMTRPSSLNAIYDALMSDFLLIPHRLQPFPHESDVVGTTSNGYIRSIGKLARDVMELDHFEDACCDEGSQAPGLTDFLHCGVFWHLCGFADKKSDDGSSLNVTLHDKLFERYTPYTFVRFRRGTKIVSIAGSEHARMCQPRRNHLCQP